MIYELETFFRSIRKEGVAPSIRKVVAYFSQILQFLKFLASPRPKLSTAESAVEYAWTRYRGLFRPGQVRSEITDLAGLVSKLQPEIVVEIGTANGGTFFLWTQMASPIAELISIDLPGGIHGGGYPFWRSFLYQRFAQAGQKVHLVRGSSYEPSTAELIARLLRGRKIDFLFIDGDHTLEGVKKDFETYSPMVRPGGIIAFHDICLHPPEQNCTVDVFWSQVKQRHECVEYVENVNQGWAGIGVLLPKAAA